MQVNRDREKQAEHAEADCRGDPVGDREVPLTEERQRKQGLWLEALPEKEDKDDDDAADDHFRDRDPVRSDLAPVVALAFDESENDREEADGREDHADDVPSVPTPRADVGDDQECRDEGRDADRDVDEEDPRPAEICDERATNRRSGDGGETGHAAPNAERSSAPLGRKQRGDDGQGLRCQNGAADALEDAEGDELGGVLRDAAQR